MLVRLAASAFANALLLFLVQPMFGRLVLPVLGGSPSVWTSCMLFFQLALLAGYGYAHLGLRFLGVRRHARLHAALIWLPAATLPIGLRLWGPPSGDEGAVFVLVSTALSVGAPFLALSAAAPLLQAWAAAGGVANPYPLYAMSNAGSFAALLLYPLVIEPRVALTTQGQWWTAGYLVVTLAITVNALLVPAAAPPVAADTGDVAIPLARRLRWVALAAAPSSLLLGTTTSLTLDVAPIPLLWVLPLALYLASFVLVFSDRGRTVVREVRQLLPFVVLPQVLLFATGIGLLLAFQITLHLATLAVLATLCHAALADDRPAPSQLTAFYFWVSLGGALGGLFNALVAPQLFLDVTEFPLAVAVSVAMLVRLSDLRALVRRPSLAAVPVLAGVVLGAGLLAMAALGWPLTAATPVLAVAAVVALSVSREPARLALAVVAMLVVGGLTKPNAYGRVLERSRTFFGVYRVVQDGPAERFRTLYHGTTMHGRERTADDPPEPLAYYHRGSPVGELLALHPERQRRVAVVGLGVGALAAYARPGEAWTFYEIDREVERIARDAQSFRFLSSCRGRCAVVPGDGRLTLSRSTDRYDVIVLDAFSSDAVPMHLLTTEAGALYLSHLTDDGVIAFHLSNKFLDLPRVVDRMATALGVPAIGRVDVVPDDGAGASTSVWVMVAPQRAALEPLGNRADWKWLTPDHGAPWTDDFSSLWGVVRW